MLNGIPIATFIAALLIATFAIHHAAAQEAQEAAQSQPPDRPIVYAWYPARFGTWNTDSIRWDLLTHISYRAVSINADGSLTEGLGQRNDENLRRFVEKAHQNGVKVTVLVWVNNREDSDGYIANHREKVAQNLLEYVQRYNLDGVNMDDEKMREFNEVAQQPNRELVTDFFRILHETFKQANPDYHISYASPPVISPDDRYGESWLDLAAIAQYVDHIIPMGYELNSAGIGWASHREPLAGGGRAPTTTTRDISTMVADYIRVMGEENRHKLAPGVSLELGGFEFRTRTDQPLSPTIGRRGDMKSLAEMEASAAAHGRRWHDLQAAPWYVYRDDDAFVQGWFSDMTAWETRLNWIREQGLGGIGHWVLDGQNDPDEKWQLIETYINAHNSAEEQ